MRELFGTDRQYIEARLREITEAATLIERDRRNGTATQSNVRYILAKAEAIRVRLEGAQCTGRFGELGNPRKRSEVE